MQGSGGEGGLGQQSSVEVVRAGQATWEMSAHGSAIYGYSRDLLPRRKMDTPVSEVVQYRLSCRPYIAVQSARQLTASFSARLF